MNQYIQSKKEELEKAIDFFKKDIVNLRTGRVNPAILEGVQVEAYGAKSAINGLANISVSDARSMVIAPWDKNIIKEIERAIVDANLGIEVINEGDKIRIIIPQMTEESRKKLVKQLNEKHEKARISIRQIRDEIKESIEEAEKTKEITEDDKYKFIKELDEEIVNKNNELKEMRDKKDEDIMTV